MPTDGITAGCAVSAEPKPRGRTPGTVKLWLAMFDDVLLAQSAVDRFKNAAYDFVIDGESYRPRQKPKIDAGEEGTSPAMPAPKQRPHPRARKR